MTAACINFKQPCMCMCANAIKPVLCTLNLRWARWTISCMKVPYMASGYHNNNVLYEVTKANLKSNHDVPHISWRILSKNKFICCKNKLLLGVIVLQNFAFSSCHIHVFGCCKARSIVASGLLHEKWFYKDWWYQTRSSIPVAFLCVTDISPGQSGHLPRLL